MPLQETITLPVHEGGVFLPRSSSWRAISAAVSSAGAIRGTGEGVGSDILGAAFIEKIYVMIYIFFIVQVFTGLPLHKIQQWSEKNLL